MSDTVKWSSYDFYVLPKESAWHAVGGVYIFTGKNAQGLWYPLYIGQAESLAARIPTHERWQEAARLGATHVHAMVVQQEANRDTIERELIAAYQPTLNEHHK